MHCSSRWASAFRHGQSCCGAGQHAGRELRAADQAVPGPGAGHARRQEVKAPGKHFNGLTGAEAAADYWVVATEYTERHHFERHAKAWGAAHTGPGIRFICDSDAVDDPDHKGFWATVGLWNRWRHETYKDDREAEKEYLDELHLVRTASQDRSI